MLYLGIDQHKRQLTVNLRCEDGSVILKRQVSTQWEKVRVFCADLAEKARREGGFLAILEVCGMNPWLLEMLKEYGCREIVVIQPTERSRQKTDRRDASELSHVLWVHRQQFLGGRHPLGLRRIQPTAGPCARPSDLRWSRPFVPAAARQRAPPNDSAMPVAKEHRGSFGAPLGCELSGPSFGSPAQRPGRLFRAGECVRRRSAHSTSDTSAATWHDTLPRRSGRTAARP